MHLFQPLVLPIHHHFAVVQTPTQLPPSLLSLPDKTCEFVDRIALKIA
jgi:hypothetical protein